jgi:hypothetical protein
MVHTQWGQSFLENPYKEESSLKVSLSCYMLARARYLFGTFMSSTFYITSFFGNNHV